MDIATTRPNWPSGPIRLKEWKVFGGLWLSEQFALWNSRGQFFPDNHCGHSTVYTTVVASLTLALLGRVPCVDVSCNAVVLHHDGEGIGFGNLQSVHAIRD